MKDKRPERTKTLFFFIIFFINVLCSQGALFSKEVKPENVATVIPFTNGYKDPINATARQEEETNSKPRLCHVKACQNRFRTYSDIDFTEKEEMLWALKFENVRYGSLFEYLRDAIIRCDLGQIEKFERALQAGSRSASENDYSPLKNLPLIKYWLMLDKLIREKHMDCMEALIYYTDLVVNLLPQITNERSVLESAEIRSVKLSTLRHAIKSHKPAELIIKILVDVAREESPTFDESWCLLSLIGESLDMPQVNSPGAVLPNDFIILPIALQEFPHDAIIKWLDNALFHSGTDNGGPDEMAPLFIHLAPFYLPFLVNDETAVFWERLEYPCEFDLNRESTLILDKFIEMTEFNTYTMDDSVFKTKSAVIDSVLGKFFQVIDDGTEAALLLAVERGALHLLEAILKHTRVFMDLDNQFLGKFIFHTISMQSLEAAILILTYRPVEKDEFISYWKSFEGSVNVSVNPTDIGALKEFLLMSEEIHADIEECVPKSEIDDENNHETIVIHRLPEPHDYARCHSSVVLCNYYLSRLILARYFSVSFVMTRIKYDAECWPSWKEQIDTINVFLSVFQRRERIQII